MSGINRRSFISGLSAAFGAASVTDLRSLILDNGAPILLRPTTVSNQIRVATNGALALGDTWSAEEFTPLSWRQYFTDIGARSRRDFLSHAEDWEVTDLDSRIDDEYWPGIFESRYEPPAACYHFLRDLKIGPKTLAKRPRNGRLDFFAGSNHPGSNDLWVEAWDDLSVSLLQARLIELGHPIEIVMECAGSIYKDDPDAYGDFAADE